MDYSFIAGGTGSTGSCHPCSVTKCPCSKTPVDRIATIKNSNNFSSADNAKTQANISSLIKDGSLLSATIDLNGVTGRQKIVSSANPEVTITSSSGTGVVVKLLTTKDASNNHMVHGVTISNRGEGYRDHLMKLKMSQLNRILNFLDFLKMQNKLMQTEIAHQSDQQHPLGLHLSNEQLTR